jgi:integrase
MRRPPKYVHGFIDRHGRPRFYFRRRGLKEVPLPGLPWSPTFMNAYEQALAGQAIEVGAGRVKPGTMRALALSFFNSPSFHALRPTTRSTYRNIITRLCEQRDNNDHPIGDKAAAGLQREHVVKLMAARAAKPDSANGLRKALRAMMRHAVEMGIRSDDPTRDVKAIRVKSDGYHSWTEGEIAQFENRHPIGTRARLALALLLFTGQRRGDVVRMGKQHLGVELVDGDQVAVIRVVQEKTGVQLAVPIHPALAAIIDDTPVDLTFLTTAFGKPFTAAGFGNWFRDQCNTAGLPHCSAHGLRKAAARRLAEAGATEHMIGSITGHTSLREIVRYTRAADQKRLAVAAMLKLKDGTSSGKPAPQFAKKEKKA